MVELTTDVTLNGETVEVTVYEDTDGDGNSENQEQVTVADGSDTNSLSGFEGSISNDYWARIDLSTSNTDNTPEVHSVELTGFGVEESRTITTYVARLVSAAYRSGEGDRTANSHSITLYSSSDRTGSGTRTPGGYVSTVVSGSSRTGTLVRTIPSHVSTVVSAASRVGEGDRTASSHVSTVVSAASRVGVGVREIGSHVSTVVSAASRVGTGVRTRTAHVARLVSSSNRKGEGTRTATTYHREIISTAYLSVDATVSSHVSHIYSSATGGAVSIITGTVTLQGDPVEGAKLYGINDATEEVEDTATTDVNGEYVLKYPIGDPGHVAVQYEDDDGNYYNDESYPFLN